MLTELIRQYVLEECGRSGNVFGPAFFDQHLAVVAEHAVCLAARLGADAQAVELAAYLHDLSAVRNVATLPGHAKVSAAQARDLLSGHGCPAGLVESVARSIASHSSPVQIGSGSPEEVCVSNADAISLIVRPAYWFYFAFGVRRFGFSEGREWLRQRMEGNWNSLVEPARELVGNRYMLARELLD